jgi:hypothetical protein
VANSLSGTGGYISEVTPTGTSTVISGLDDPQSLAIDSAGDLFIADNGPGDGNIEEITSTGSDKIFTTDVAIPEGLAFQPVPEPSVLALLAMGASAMALRLRRKA